MTTTEAPCASVRLPFLNGVYVAVDALAGAYLIVDGPYCVFTKAEMQYCHNLRSRLLPPIGHRRVVHTGQVQDREEVKSLSTDRTAQVDGIFAGVCAQPDAGIVLSTTFDFHELVGFPMKEITRRHARPGGPLVGHIPSKSLGGTWLEGYARTCEALARSVTFRPGRRSRERTRQRPPRPPAVRMRSPVTQHPSRTSRDARSGSFSSGSIASTCRITGKSIPMWTSSSRGKSSRRKAEIPGNGPWRNGRSRGTFSKSRTGGNAA